MTVDLGRILARAVEKARAPGAVAVVGCGAETLYSGATGLRRREPVPEPAALDTLYDLASLTKVVSTTTAVMLLKEDGKLSLDQRVSEWLPLPGLDRFTLRHLITHTSGLEPFKVWYKEITGPEDMVGRIAALPPGHPPGAARVYSDLGFILLGQVAEKAAREPLAQFVKRRVFSPLKMRDTMFTPPETLRPRCAPTEKCAWRGRILQGEVHDENAFAMGGVSGHAGLFSTAPDLALFCRALLAGKLLKPETLDEMLLPGRVPTYPWQGLGWWLDPRETGANGFLPARTVFGHTGFTGTSLWMDRASGLFAVLLSNTCHPSRARRDNGTLRRMFHTAVALDRYPASCNAQNGLDMLLRDGFEGVRGKRKTALLTNTAAVDRLERPALDVLGLDPGVRVGVLFAPEHGLRVQAEAGERVGTSTDGPVPVISLYGDQKRPLGGQLSGVDLMVVDLPDVGARWYTYMATMKGCLEACADAGVPVMVLDRPNPLGGVVLEGGLPADTTSLVCAAAVPARHGMTMGELALFFQAGIKGKKKLDLTVKPVENWRRELLFDQCALPWVPPSPNLPSFDSALAYAGTCLFEGVNLNEGRGTETPFLRFGAPWLDNEGLADALSASPHAAGMTLKKMLYIPKAIPGRAASPEYKGLLCRGVDIGFTDRAAARPFALAAAILAWLVKRHADTLKWKPHFDALTGGPGLRRRLAAGASAEELLAEAAAAHAPFDAARPRLYQTGAEQRAALEK